MSNVVRNDKIPAKILKQDKSSLLLSKIIKTFTHWIQTSKIWSYMIIGRLILISKDKLETPTIENIRPITILPSIAKFFEQTILYNLERIAASDQLCKNQSGFTKGKSTWDNIAEVLSIAKISKR